MKFDLKELKQRLLTGLLLASFIVIIIFYLPTLALGVMFSFFVLLGGREWAYLAGIHHYPIQISYGILLVLFAWYIWLYANIKIILLISIGFWFLLTLFFLVWQYYLQYFISIHILFNKLIIILFGILILPSTLIALMTLHKDYPHVYLLYLFILVWSADSIAYFAGKVFGKHPLIPSISPSKTQEGLFWAMLMSIPLSIMVAWLWQVSAWLIFIILSIATVFFALVGDLFESALKRYRGVKHSGSLLPGHGGVMDRVDSLTAAAPFFLTGLWYIGIQ